MNNSIKDRFRETNLEIHNFICYLNKHTSFKLISFICILTAYGFSIFNRSISIDDLGQNLYYGLGNLKIAGTRWGHVLLNRIFQTIEFTPFVDKFFNILFIFISGVLFCCLLSYLHKDNNIWKYTIITCIWSTYPLIAENFEYRESMILFFDFILVFYCLLFMTINNKNNIKNILLMGSILSIVMAGYESAMFAYVTIVFIIIYLNIKYERIENYNWFLDGLRYALPLIIALALRYGIGFALIKIYGISYAQNGNSGVKWLSEGFSTCFKQILYNGWYYIIRGLSYFPIGEFVLATVLFIFFVIKDGIKKKILLLIGLFLFISVFSLSIVQGDWLSYNYAAAVYVYMAYVVYLIMSETHFDNFKVLNKALVIGLLFVCLRQSVYTHTILALNNQRSDNEIAVIQQLGSELYANYDISKDVIVCGEYQFGSFIEDQITIHEDSFAYNIEKKIRQLTGHEEMPSNIEYVLANSSVINWSRHAMEGSMMKEFFSYCGYDINVPETIDGDEQEYLLRYEKIAQENEMKPLSIKDMGDYILIYLGPTLENKY